MKTILAGALAGLLLFAACGGDDDDVGGDAPRTGRRRDDRSDDGRPGARRRGTRADARRPSRGRRPERIVSLSPTHTEMLFAIGAGDQVVAVDRPVQLPGRGGRCRHRPVRRTSPNVEAIAGYEPDLVVTDGTNPDLIAQLDSLGIDHWEGPAPVDVRRRVRPDRAARRGDRPRRRGRRAGRPDAGGHRRDRRRRCRRWRCRCRYYHELDDTYFSVTSDTFIGQVYNARRPAQHRRRGRGRRRRLPAAQRRVHHLRQPRPDLPRRRPVLRADGRRRVAPGPAGTPSRPSPTATSSRSTTTSPRGGGPRVVDYVRTVADAVHAASPSVPSGDASDACRDRAASAPAMAGLGRGRRCSSSRVLLGAMIGPAGPVVVARAAGAARPPAVDLGRQRRDATPSGT